jgi:Uma2 family endonuclease
MQTQLQVSETDFQALLERLEAFDLKGQLFEYEKGVVIPTQGDTPFTPEVLDILFHSEDFKTLHSLVPMPTPNHTKIIGNLYFELRSQIQRNTLPYEVFPDGLHIFVQPENYRIADATLTERPAVFNEANQLTNPLVLFEVASPSTIRKDHGIKLRQYTQIESLHAYVLLAQDEKLVEYYIRNNEIWQYAYLMGEGAILALNALNLNLSVDALYADVDFENQK